MVIDINISFEVEKEKDYLIYLRRHLHQNPELSLKEYETARFIEEQLDSFGIEYRRVGDTGVLGVINGSIGTGKTILLRADIDALPINEESLVDYCSKNTGVMHACGHDVHTAALLGAAKILKSMCDIFSGRILLVFQQAEEFGHGSRFFLQENIMEGVDRAFAIHVSPHFPVGKIAMTRGADAASCDHFKITINGKASHISKPHHGVDALYIATLILGELKTMVQRYINPLETALIGVGKLTSGSAFNIIPESAVLEGSTRTFSYETQALLKEKITEISNCIANIHGGSAIIEFETFASALINDDIAYDEIYKVACDILGADNIITNQTKIMGLGADDFSEYIRDTKGVYIHVGTATESNPNTKKPLHNSHFDVDEMSLLISTRLHVEYALSILGGIN